MSMSSPQEAKKEFSVSEWHNWLPAQRKAAEAFWRYKYVGCGGAFGGGKSRTIRHLAVEACLTYFAKYGLKHVKVGIFCKDYKNLDGRHISVIPTDYPDFLGSWVEVRKQFELRPEYGGGIIAFLNLDDPSKYRSVEFACIFIDEGSEDTRDDFETLRLRLRWPGLGDDCHMLVSFNPPMQNEDPWCRDLFIDHIFSPTEKEKEKFTFVPFPPKDNAANLPPTYFDQFGGRSDAYRKAFLDGDMHAFDNMLSDDGFRPLLTSPQIDSAISDDCAPPSASVVLGIDPGGGGDETAVAARDEFSADIIFNEKTKDPLTAIPFILDYVKKHDVTDIVVDKTGLGWAFHTRLREVMTKEHPRVRVIGIGFGEVATDKTRYKNLKMDLFWRARTWLLEKGGQLVRNDKANWKQLTVLRWKMHSDGKFMEMESKEDLRERGIASPNCADALALSMFIRLSFGSSDTTRQFRSKAVQDSYRYNRTRMNKLN